MSALSSNLPGFGGLAATFDTAAELYERARPEYPDALFADLATLTGRRGESARVLEIGAGTGKATRGLLALGWRVTALEPGAELAGVARRVLHGLGAFTLEQSTFEAWDAGPRLFDVVFAATSWHWLDQSAAFAKAARVLEPGGQLAIVTTDHVLPSEDGDDFFVDIDAAYVRAGLSDGKGPPSTPEAVVSALAPQIEASGWFEVPRVVRHVWSQEYTADEFLAVLSTYSNHIAASAAQRGGLFADARALIEARPGGVVRKHYLNQLYLARRAPLTTSPGGGTHA